MGDLDFGSEMASLEYGFLSDMVQTQQTIDSSLLGSWPTASSSLTAANTQPHMASFSGGEGGNNTTTTTTTSHPSAPDAMINVSYYPTYASGAGFPSTSSFQFDPSNLSKASSSTPALLPLSQQPMTPTPSSATTNKPMASGSTLTPQPQLHVTPREQQPQQRQLQQQQQRQQQIPTFDGPSLKKSSPYTHQEAVPIKSPTTAATVDNQHHSVAVAPNHSNENKPFNYADGFHYLIQYVKEKYGSIHQKHILSHSPPLLFFF